MAVSDILGGVGAAAGGIAGLFQSDEGEKRMKEAADLWKKLQTPGFDMAQLSPRELQLVGEYMFISTLIELQRAGPVAGEVAPFAQRRDELFEQ